MKKQTVETVAGWDTIAARILEESMGGTGATVLALTGDLGVGKTTLVQVLAKQLGVSEPVTSPTFTLMKHYETEHEQFTQLIHMDAYRIDTVDELGPLRFDELLQTPHTLFCIEWAERIESAMPADTLWLELTIDKLGKHTIQSRQ